MALETTLEEPQPLSGARRTGHRAPLLWILMPWMAGVGLGTLVTIPRETLVVGLAGIGLAGLLIFVWDDPGTGVGRTQSQTLPLALLATGALGLGCLYGVGFRTGAATARPPPGFPAREATLELRIDRIFGSSGPGSRSGLGTVVDAPQHLRWLTGLSIHYQISGSYTATLYPGSRWQFRGLLRPVIRGGNEPSPFLAWLDQRGVFWQIHRAEPLRQVAPSPPAQARFHRTQEHLVAHLRRGEPDGHAYGSLFAAALLGRSDLIPLDDKNRFLLTGTFHLFAVSGLHIGTLATLLHVLGTLLRLPRPLASLIVVLGSGAYAWVTGLTPSGVRACLLVTYFAAGRWLHRPAAGFPALVASATLVLILNPAELGSLSFQLSYTVVAGLILLGRPCSDATHRLLDSHPFGGRPSPGRIPRMARSLASSAAYSLAATVAGTPLAAEVFGVVAPGAVLLNLALVPLAGVLVADGVVSMLAGAIGWDSLAVALNRGAFLLVEVMVWITSLAEQAEGWLFFRRTVRWPGLGAVGTAILLGTCLALGPERLTLRLWPKLLVIMLVLGTVVLWTVPV